MTDILFYHLERATLEDVLPKLLEKTLENGWRAVVQVGSEERCRALDAHLWTYRDEAFLPHGTSADGHPEAQPIWLTDTEDNPNGANVRFLADGAGMPDPSGYERVVLMFDGADEEALSAARKTWVSLRDSDHETTYWQQAENGRWEKRA